MTAQEEHDQMLLENIRRSCELSAEIYRQKLFTEQVNAEPGLRDRIDTYYAKQHAERNK